MTIPSRIGKSILSKNLLLLVTAIITVITVQAQVVGPGNVNDVQFWFRADAASAGNTNSSTTWYDYSGNGRNATAVNSPAFAATAVNYNPAYYFDGTNQYFSFSPTTPTQMASGTSARTVLLVSYPDAAWNTTQDNQTGAGQTFSYGRNSNAGASYRIGAKNSRVVLDRGVGTYNWAAGMGSVPYIAGLANPATTGFIYLHINGMTDTSNWNASGLNSMALVANIGRDAIGGTRYHHGHIAEVVFYNRELTGTDLYKVQSYFALKYGITLGQVGTSAPTATSYYASDGSVYWTLDPVFKFNVTGIGRDDATLLNQKQSRSVNTFSNGNTITLAKGNTIAASNAANTATFTNDKSFFVLADDNGSLALNGSATTITVGGVTESYTRIGRTWKAGNTNNVDGTIVLQADLTYYGAGTKPSYLLVGDDANLDAATTGLKAYTLDVDGKVTINTLTNGKYFTLVNSAALTTLPVSFADELKARLNNNSIQLTWSTAMEQHSKGFTIQRSSDGISFQNLSFVASKALGGNSTQPLTYSYSDETPAQGINYYRLQQQDDDGRKTTGRIVKVIYEYSNPVLKINPNPVHDIAVITGVTTGDKIEIYNQGGQLLFATIASGNNLRWNATGLKGGAYHIKIIGAGKAPRSLQFVKK